MDEGERQAERHGDGICADCIQLYCQMKTHFCISKRTIVSVFEKTCAATRKSKKSGLWILKSVKKRIYTFKGHLITLPLVLIYRKSVTHEIM